MRILRRPNLFCAALGAVILICGCAPHFASAQTISPPQPAQRLGVQGFGAVGLDWISATESLQAVGLEPRPTEFGAGAQVNNIWRSLFTQVSVTRWSGSGERAFVDTDGSPFPLGISLDVKATYVDVSGGWKFDLRRDQSGPGVLPFIGGGVGAVMYSEKSPFAEAGDDIDERSPSYHILGGVEVRVLRWLGVAGDIRYRVVSGLLGEGGVSGALGEDNFGGMSAGAKVLVGF